MTYIGKRPSILKKGELRIEAHIINFDSDLYGKSICIEFVDYLRNDIKFESIEDLKSQLIKDQEKTIKILKK